MDVYWIPGVNQLQRFGRWAFAEFRDIWEMEHDFAKKLAEAFEQMLTTVQTDTKEISR